MEILSRHLKRCKKCKRLRGYVIEKYNGKVQVLCRCDLMNPEKNFVRSPSIISRGNDLLTWTPISDHKDENGEWRHTPYFTGFGY